jgi:glycosyltransferase involved in cell wall biosynthesis
MDGARAFWLPEPAVPSLQNLRSTDERSGCIIYGALDTRKGIDLLVRAVTLAPNSMRVVLAGSVKPGFDSDLIRFVSQMRKTGAVVEVHVNSHSETEGLNILAEARCAVLPYPRHYGMSRVLLEACSVGTPVIAHRSGLVGHLVEKYGLGMAVDCKDPRALRQALIHLCGTDRREGYTEALKGFAARFSQEVFEGAVTSPFMD